MHSTNNYKLDEMLVGKVHEANWIGWPYWVGSWEAWCEVEMRWEGSRRLILVTRRVICDVSHTPPYVVNSPLGATTKPRPLDAPRYTVSITSIIYWSALPGTRVHGNLPPVYRPLPNCYLSAPASLPYLSEWTYILLLLPVPKSIMMCLFLSSAHV